MNPYLAVAWALVWLAVLLLALGWGILPEQVVLYQGLFGRPPWLGEANLINVMRVPALNGALLCLCQSLWFQARGQSLYALAGALAGAALICGFKALLESLSLFVPWSGLVTGLLLLAVLTWLAGLCPRWQEFKQELSAWHGGMKPAAWVALGLWALLAIIPLLKL